MRHELAHLADLHVLGRERVVIMGVVKILRVFEVSFYHGAIFVVVGILQDLFDLLRLHPLEISRGKGLCHHPTVEVVGIEIGEIFCGLGAIVVDHVGIVSLAVAVRKDHGDAPFCCPLEHHQHIRIGEQLQSDPGGFEGGVVG